VTAPQEIRKRLDDLLADADRRLADLRRDEADTFGDASPLDGPDPGFTEDEAGTEMGLARAAEADREEILAALSRLDRGTYGTCVVGHEPIEEERLEANPATPFCRRHAPG
jgi:RNA polymerase-binding transcription factor DksA